MRNGRSTYWEYQNMNDCFVRYHLDGSHPLKAGLGELQSRDIRGMEDFSLKEERWKGGVEIEVNQVE